MGRRFQTIMFRGWLGGARKDEPKVHRVGSCHGQTFSLAHASNRNPSGDLAWGDTGPASLNLARAILAEVGGPKAVEKHGDAFLHDVISRLPATEPFAIPADDVRQWLAGRSATDNV